MPILNAASDAMTTTLETDVCIIGAGPAGLALAAALPPMRRPVTVVESGGVDPNPALASLNEIVQQGDALRQDFMSRVRLLGGASNLWPGRCMRLRPRDLAPRPWVPHSGWPLAYDELSQYYPGAARLLRLPPLPETSDASDCCPVIGAEGRLTGADELAADWALWAKSPLRFGKAMGPLFKPAKGDTLVLNLTALELRVNEGQNQVTAIRAAGPDGKVVELRARVFVLACGGLENARLLLASRSQAVAGIGNGTDQVGRYYMDHPRAVAARLRLTGRPNLGRLLGVPLADGRLKLGLTLAPTIEQTEGMVGCLVELEPAYSPGSTLIYGSALEVVRRVHRRRFGHQPDMPVSWGAASRYLYQLTVREIMPHRLYHLLHHLRKRRATELVTVLHCEQAPDPANRVTLTHERDHLGLPRLGLHWRVGEAERRSARRLLQALDVVCQRHGLGALADADGSIQFGDAAHPMGTTRMSSDPRHGVVDADCRVHGIANLYVTGSSVFPTGGYANPTLTIVALALRLADHLRLRPELQ